MVFLVVSVCSWCWLLPTCCGFGCYQLTLIRNYKEKKELLIYQSQILPMVAHTTRFGAFVIIWVIR